MSDKKGESVKEFENECEEILQMIVVEQAFFKNRKRITTFIEHNSALCTDLINSEQFKSCLFILNRLYNICVEILRNFTPELDSKGDFRQFFTQLKVKEKQNTSQSKDKGVDIPSLITLTQSFNALPDITELKTPESFHYSLVLEHFLQIVNNLALINLKRNKIDATIDLLSRAVEACKLTKCCSYFIKFHLSTIIVNLVYLTEENFREEATQLLCNLALYLEKLEKDLDNHPQSNSVYEYLSNKANTFALFIEMKDQVFGKKSFTNPKSFLLARMCLVMAYYGDLLNELGNKQEAEVARQHTKSLEQQLIRTEQSKPRFSEESKASQSAERKLNSRDSEKRLNGDDDNYSLASFKSANSQFTGTGTGMGTQNKISKESIIYQKYVEVNGVKFKILMVHLKELQAVQIIVYSKPRNMLKKIFVHFQEILEYSKKLEINVDDEKDANKILTKIAKLLYFKDNELLMREINFFRSIEELKNLALDKGM